jgi:two-component system, sensor histidine kinase PdtaS
MLKERIAYANQVYKEAKAEKSEEKLAEAYYLFGKFETSQNHFQKATEWFLKSLKIQEKRKDYRKLTRLKIWLSEIENTLGHHKESLNQLYEAKGYALKSGFERDLIGLYMQFGTFYLIPIDTLVKFQNDSAFFYLKNAEKLGEKYADTLSLAQIYSQIGALYLQKKDSRSIKYFQNAVAFQEILKQEDPLISNSIALAISYINFDNFPEALLVFKNIEEKIAKGWQIYPNTKAYLEVTYAYYFEKKGNYQAALNHYRLAHEIEKTVYAADREGAVSKLNIQYETVKKEEAIKANKKNLALQQKIIWGITIAGLLAAILSIIFYKLFKKNKALSQRNAMLLQEQNHRVKNNLQVVSSLLSLQSNMLDEGKAKEAVDESQLRIEAMTILHQQLYNTDETVEKIDMERYIPELTEVIIQTFKLDVETTYDIQQKYVMADKAILLALVINELVTNACKYVFSKKEIAALHISLFKEKNEVKLIVKDNGDKAIEQLDNRKKNKNSFGIKLVNMMAFELNGVCQYSYKNGSEFSLNFPNN